MADLVANLQYLDPESTVLLYDGSGGSLRDELSALERPGVLVHPSPSAMAWGKLHNFAIDCMNFALRQPDFATLTVVDSDQLAVRAGYSAYLDAFLAGHPQAGCLVSVEGVQPRTTRVGPPQVAWREYEMWAPFLARFADGQAQFPHWTFWPTTVFTAAAAEDLVELWADEQLQNILARSAIWASEEVVLPTLVAVLGHQVLRNPCAHDIVQYRAKYTAAQIDSALSDPSVFWVHPVPRSYRDPLRARLRAHFGGYLSTPPAARDRYVASATPPLPRAMALLARMDRIEGWLSAAEADLLAGAVVRAMSGRPGPHTIVELGSYCGRGTVVLAGLAAAISPGSLVHAIDPHDGRLGVWGAAPGGVPDAATRLRSHLDSMGLAGTVCHHRGYAADTQVPGPIDLLVIDHLHDYASVATDFSQFQEQLVDGGLVAFHDYSDSFPDVRTFADQLVATGAYTAVQRVETLAVLRKEQGFGLPRLGPALAGAKNASERDALALQAMTTAVTLRVGVGSQMRDRSAAALDGESVDARAEVGVAGRMVPGHVGEPLVSCLMPTCDRRRFMGRAIRYFLEQDYGNRELLVVDDGADCVADLMPADPRIRYVRLPERRTIGAKRNLACEQAAGDLIVHWDDDDWSAPWRLRYQVEMFGDQDVDVSGLSGLLFCDPAAGLAWRYQYPSDRRPWVHDPTFCYRRSFWEQAPFPDANFGIDTRYLWNGSAKSIGVLPDSSFYVARIHSGNTSRKNVADAWWQPRPVQDIADLMGPEWTRWSPECCAEPARESCSR